MSIFFQRFFMLLLAVVLQHSFLDILWPNLETPSILIAVIISYVFLLGFKRSIGWVLLVAWLSLLIGEVSVFPVFAVGIAYGASFLSRRLRIEHRVQNVFALSLVAAFSASIYMLSLTFLQGTGLSPWLVLGNALVALAVFPIIFGVFRWHEEQIETSLMSEFRGVRS